MAEPQYEVVYDPRRETFHTHDLPPIESVPERASVVCQVPKRDGYGNTRPCGSYFTKTKRLFRNQYYWRRPSDYSD